VSFILIVTDLPLPHSVNSTPTVSCNPRPPLLTPFSFSPFLLRFIQEQDNYITHLSAESKRAGVLAPFAKFPSFVDRLQQVRP
jgi:hypothetical protein